MAPVLVIRIRAPVAPGDVDGLCARVCRRVCQCEAAAVVAVDVSAVAADASALCALARLTLAARRGGWSVRLRGASAEMRELIEFAGLAGVMEY